MSALLGTCIMSRRATMSLLGWSGVLRMSVAAVLARLNHGNRSFGHGIDAFDVLGHSGETCPPKDVHPQPF